MEEEGIKSAFELAMERISALPGLTPEEKAEQKERKYGPLGRAIAVKYMGGLLSESDLSAELRRYQGDPQQIVRRELVSGLCREMNLENNRETAERALKGLAGLAEAKKELLKEAERDFWKIVGEFGALKEEKFCEFRILANERFRALGISGSAIRPNLNENEQWKRESAVLQQIFEPKVQNLRDMLARDL